MTDLLPSPSLTRRVFGAVAWTMSGYTLSLVIRFGTNLLLARLLAPDVFGILAIATVVMIGLTLCSDLGLRAHIVQSRRGNEKVFLDTAWSVQIVRGLALTIVALVIAVGLAVAAQARLLPLSSVYADPRLPGIIAAISVTALIAGFTSTKYYEAGRRLALGRVTAIELSAQIIGLMVTFAWLGFDRSIWALVVGQIAGALVLSVLSHTVLPGGRNELSWEPIALHELLHFGKWIFLSSVLTFFATSADKLILGALTGATFLGLYTIAFNLVDLPAQLVGRLMLNAAFPALSQVARERTQDLKRVYYKFHSVAAPAAYLLAGMLFVASPMIISTLYDARYREAGWIMQCLSFSLLALPFQLAGHHFTAIGKPELISVVLVARVLGLLTATPLAFHFFQLPGVVAAIVLAHLCVVPVLAFFSWRLGLLDIRKEATATIGFPVGVAIGLGIDTALRTLHEALGS